MYKEFVGLRNKKQNNPVKMAQYLNRYFKNKMYQWAIRT